MNDAATLSSYGELIQPMTVRLERMLPGPVERVWSYLTESDLRGQWLATGEMPQQPGASVDLVWRNDDLSGRQEQRPAEIPAERRMACEVIRAEPPRLLVLGWGASGSEVTFELASQGAEVLLTVTHRRLPDRGNLLGVSAGWHAHLDILVARLRGAELPLFWANWTRLRSEYDQRIPQ
jgi:uncharacterized protein YndB with AHSA1/START domain